MTDTKKQEWFNAAFNMMVWSFLIGLGVLGFQAFQWLKTGIWEPGSVRHILETMQVQLEVNAITWVGIRQIVEWLLNVHVSWYLCGAIPGLIIFIVTSLEERNPVGKRQ